MPDIDLMGATYPDVPAVTLPSGATTATFYYPDEIDYASSPSSGGNANRANAILYGTVDSTSTATVFTATVEGLTALVDGTTVMLHNGVVTSASGFTVNVNGLGAKKCYNNMTNATQDTTIFNASYTMLFVYSTSLDSGNGGWWIYRGYDGNTNTIGYQLRSNSSNLVASDTGYRYRLWLTSADGSKWVPINTSTSTNATTARTLNTRPIDPFGPIVYRSTNGTCAAGTGIGATAIWQQYTLAIGYSYMASGFSLTAQDSVYLRCTPQTDGSAVMQDIVQTLPTSKDGKIYIHLGTAYSTTNMELTIEHAVYWHDGTGIRLWTGAESGGGPEPSSTTPAMDGTAAVGTATTYARADHVHPTDTSRQATLVSGTNIKTINGTSILGSGDITTPTYTLPTASTSTLGGVKVDGSTITIADGVISSSGGGGGVSGRAWYGTCTTAAATAAKAVVCNSSFTLTDGVMICVLFNASNEYERTDGAYLTLNVNNTGKVPIVYREMRPYTFPWDASDILTFIYRQPTGEYDPGAWAFVATNNPLPLMQSASVTSRGVVKVGDGLSIDSDGTLSVVPAGQHTLTLTGSSLSGNCVSVSTDGTYSTGVYASSAMADDTVTVVFKNHWSPTIIRTDTSSEITTTRLRKEYVGSYYCGIYEFTMPDADVTINCWYDD